jgi:Tfp pilus tip-associated adhesin PilY1
MLHEGSPGWKIDLAGKVLSESLTVNGVVLFTTYRPATASACASDGSGEVYAVTIDTGAAALDLNRDGEVLGDDLSVALDQPGIPGAPRIEVVTPGATGPGGAGPGGGAPTNPEQGGGTTRCYVGVELMSRCVSLGTLLRTFWKRALVN